MGAASPDLAIRPARPADREALFDICLRTADAGRDATALLSDGRLPGYVWAVPYLVIEPDFAFVLADSRRTVGYVIAARDTAAFAARLAREWWPQIRRQTAGMKATRPLDEMVLRHIANPEPPLDWLCEAYPAHLHINLLPEAQSRGWGRRLVETELVALEAHGVVGVHLGVSPRNVRAQAFYRHLGFEDLSRDGHVIFGKKLAGPPARRSEG